MASASNPISYPLDVGALQTRVIEAGDGPRTVLFLHGAGARADRWTPTVARLGGSKYRCIAVDFPGHGFATKGPAPDYSVSGFTSFVQALIAKLDLDNPAIVGTSLGGHVAASLALRSARRVRGLVLVGAVGLIPLDSKQAQSIAVGLSLTKREEIAMKLRFVLRDQSLITEALIEEEWRINTSRGAAAGFEVFSKYWIEAHHSHLVGPQLAASCASLPLRLIWGADDRSTPLEMGKSAADLLTGGELHVIPDAGHAPYLDAPDLFDAVLMPFLGGLPWDS